MQCSFVVNIDQQHHVIGSIELQRFGKQLFAVAHSAVLRQHHKVKRLVLCKAMGDIQIPDHLILMNCHQRAKPLRGGNHLFAHPVHILRVHGAILSMVLLT